MWSSRVVVASVIVLTILTWPIVAIAAQLTLTWIDASTGELGFAVERSTGTTGSFAEVARTGSGATTYTDSTVATGTTYCYRVRAFNASGYSVYSDVACGTPMTAVGLAVVKVDTGDGTVTSAPPGISCGATCSASYASGATVTLTATAAPGSTFTGWIGGGCSGSGTCTVTIVGATTVTAGFALKAASALGVTPQSLTFTKIVGQPVPPAQTVTVTAVPGQVWTTHDNMPFADVTGQPFNGSDGVTGTGPGTFQVVPSSGMTSLATGTYTGSITVNTAGSADIVISVQVIVTAPSALPPPAPPLAPPPPPLTDAQLTLTWIDASTGELGFAVERSTGTTGSFAEVTRTGPGVTTYTDPTVAAATTYCYRVRAFNAVHYSAYSNVACGTPVTSALAVTPQSLTFTQIVGQPTPPAQTVTVTASAGQVWTTHDAMGFADVTGLPFNGSDGVTGTGPGAFQVVPTIGMTFLAADVYTGFITVNTAGSADIVISVQVIVTAPSPASPLSPPPPPLTATQLTLTWIDASTDELGFAVERSTGTTGSFAEVTRTGPGVTTYTDPTVAAATTYCYRVRAFNSVDYSAYSNVACGTPAAAK